MKAGNIADNIFAIHVDICDSPYFEGIWPIPHGVSLNSYLVKGKGEQKKTALIDLVREWEEAPQRLLEQIKQHGVEFDTIDYLILNHLEPDHTGYIQEFVKFNPKLQIISTTKGLDLVKKFCKVENVEMRAVKTGDSLDLGGGTVLQFFETPNVHWPETMMTYEKEHGVLFSCDGFGGYGKTGNRIFDDEFTAEEISFFMQEALRYYATIVASFSTAVNSAIAKFADVPIKVVAPSHGLVWRKNPQFIIDKYKAFAGYNTGGKQEKKVCVIWGSMYGHTKLGVDAVVEGLRSEGVDCVLMEIPSTDVSQVLAAAYPAKALVIAMPTYEYKMFPPMAYVLNLFARKHFIGKKVLRIGSWGWIGGAKKEYDEAISSLKWDCMESHEWQGIPSAEDLVALRQKGVELAQSL